EWNGLTSTPVDVTASSTEGSDTTTHPTGTTATTTSATAIAMTMHIWRNERNARFSSYSPGFTKLFQGYATLIEQVRSYYQILSGTGTQSATLTLMEPGQGASLIAVFKAVSGGLLAADTYAYRVTALASDGAESAASGTIAVYHPASGAATQLE